MSVNSSANSLLCAWKICLIGRIDNTLQGESECLIGRGVDNFSDNIHRMAGSWRKTGGKIALFYMMFLIVVIYYNLGSKLLTDVKLINFFI